MPRRARGSGHSWGSGHSRGPVSLEIQVSTLRDQTPYAIGIWSPTDEETSGN